MNSNLRTFYQKPTELLNILSRSEPDMKDDPSFSVEVYMYELAINGEIDLHVCAEGEDGCLATMYTRVGELPLLGYGQYYIGRMSQEDIKQRLDEISATTLDNNH